MSINLSKTGDFHKIDLSKKSLNNIRVHANLNWNQQAKSSGLFNKLFKSNSSCPDLDLGCMYEMVDGRKEVIQPLGGCFGSKTEFPFIFLDRDDRTGASNDGENLVITRPELVKRIIFFALIYSGASSFQSAGANMTFSITNGESVTLQLNDPDNHSVFCAAAMLINENNELILTKEERYFNRHKSADEYYGFGFNWEVCSK